MQVRFLLGPAGSGKTFRCLTEIRRALAASPEGGPLLFLAPKQTTYQLERQLLSDPSVPGYTRLQIISFERLADFVFSGLGKPPPKVLDEEGRLMVLRGLLAKKRGELKLFRASARLNGFAQQLSHVLHELQQKQLTPDSLRHLAEKVQHVETLTLKLQDLACLLEEYLAWLEAHHLQDSNCLLAAAAKGLHETAPSTDHNRLSAESSTVVLEQLWVDGFAELSPTELDLLTALVARSQRATIAFCLEQLPVKNVSWLSNWSVIHHTFEECRRRMEGLPEIELVTEWLGRDPKRSRFANQPVLQHLERFWNEAQPVLTAPTGDCLRVVACLHPEAEATFAAREVLQHVRAGGRFREVMVLVRSLEPYYRHLERVLDRYEIPCFVDRRQPISHHPLAELTRSALRTVAGQWQSEDWFTALKTGLVPASPQDIDRLENEALARGWAGSTWLNPIAVSDDADLSRWLAALQLQIVPPFHRLALALAKHQNRPTGPQLTAALREFWKELNIEEQLQEWSAQQPAESEPRAPSLVHATTFEQMNSWLDNVELGFPNEALRLREWLPILEAGLASLTVGMIPPALDQVVVGAIDRSRTPDVKVVLVLGLNEGVFPMPPASPSLLNETDRLELEKHQILLDRSPRQQMAREIFFAYIACTRARERIILTHALHDENGAPLNPSPFLWRLCRLFPALKFETLPKAFDWRKSEHVSELIGMMVKMDSVQSRAPLNQSAPHRKPAILKDRAFEGEQRSSPGDWQKLLALPKVQGLLERLRQFQVPQLEESLRPELAAQLYGPVLRTSVSRLEQFASCPFKFFIHSGLRAEERQLFELDFKAQGTFQHDVLARFHEELGKENRKWRDISPDEARDLVGRIAEGLTNTYRDGLLRATEQSRFMARLLTERLQDFIQTIVTWMRQQYEFDPVEVELEFGQDDNAPAWAIALRNDNRLELRGRIDRVDICHSPDPQEDFCIVVDYKSGEKRLDPVLVANGLQLQLLAYSNVLRHWPNPRARFGVNRLVPVGVFYVNLRGKYQREPNRLEALANAEQGRNLVYRHTGRFDANILRRLDARADVRQGDQFNYRLTNSGQPYKNCRDPVATAQFQALLDSVESQLKQMGEEIFAGSAQVAPYRRGTFKACDQCAYQAICRIDPWTHRFRVLKKA